LPRTAIVAELEGTAPLTGNFHAPFPTESADVVTGTQPDGTVNFSGGSIAAGVGFSWGHGDLNYGGESHAFKISGVSLVDVGAANVSASGHVYNLKNLADFNGNYVAMTAGMTVAGGDRRRRASDARSRPLHAIEGVSFHF